MGTSSGCARLVNDIRAKIALRQYEFTRHAVDQSMIRRIGVAELEEAVECGEVIEDYPDGKYGPSCLILGRTRAGRALHMQCSHPSRSFVKAITVYEPDASLWLDLRVRRSR